MLFDFYLNWLLSAKKELAFLFIGIIFFILGIPGIHQGLRGITKGRIFLYFKDNSDSYTEKEDTRSGTFAQIWGILYIFLGFTFAGVGLVLIWVFIASFFKH